MRSKELLRRRSNSQVKSRIWDHHRNFKSNRFVVHIKIIMSLRIMSQLLSGFILTLFYTLMDYSRIHMQSYYIQYHLMYTNHGSPQKPTLASNNPVKKYFSCSKESGKDIKQDWRYLQLRWCCNEHDTIYAISSVFGDRMTTQSMGLIVLLSEHF